MEVGIVGSATDLHSEVVRWALSEGGVQCHVLDTLRGAHLYEGASLHLDDAPSSRDGIRNQNLRALWYRRHHKVRSSTIDAQDSNDAFRSSERNVLQENIITALSTDPTIGWVNNPQRARVAESKFVQLSFAKAAGLRVPSTLMTADPKEIRAFAARHEEVVVKPFGVYAWEHADRSRTFAMASKVAAARLLNSADEALSNTPAIYQCPIEKTSDLRVVIIGEEVFAYNVVQDGDADFDCRFAMANPEKAQIKPHSLRPDQEEQIRGFLGLAGIDMASADFALMPQGEIVFLDLNPAGAWLFLEETTPDISLTQQLCRLLCAKAGITEVRDFPSFAEFNRSRSTQEFRQRVLDASRSGVTVENDRTWKAVA